MSIIEYGIMDFQTDIFGNLPPSALVRLAIESSTREAKLEGISFERLKEEFDATWMAARIRLETERPVCGGNILTAEVTPSAVKRGCFYRQITFFCGDERVGRCVTACMPVVIGERRILRPETLYDGYSVSGPAPDIPEMHRLRSRERGDHICDITVRGWDCDFNGHMTAARYADFACEAAGYWTGMPKLMRSMQIDYCAECYVGEVLSMSGKQTEDGLIVTGVHFNGRTAFLAMCDMCNLNLDKN